MWLDDDQDKAVAWMEEQADRCRCGRPKSETTAPENQGVGVYHIDVVECAACKAVEDLTESIRSAGGKTGHLLMHVLPPGVKPEQPMVIPERDLDDL